MPKKKKSTVNQAGNYTKPGMRKRLVEKIKRGSKGGKTDGPQKKPEVLEEMDQTKMDHPKRKAVGENW
jgi:hypothetical protein